MTLLEPPPTPSADTADKSAKVPVNTWQPADYSLTGHSTQEALQKGLANADWYTSPIPKDKMRELLERKDGPAIRDTIIWFALLIGTGIAGAMLWGSAWAIIPFAIYGIIYATTSDSRWHESSHGTAFKTDWMNNALYEIASFMVVRESTVWRWSHARHHSDTIIVGRDPEIAVPRPPDIIGLILSFFMIKSTYGTFKTMMLHSTGKLTADEATFIPESEAPKVYFKARICLAIYASVVATAIITQSWLPLMYIGLPTLYGSWLMPIYGYTQHAGLAENVLDHRLNCRTVYMNWIHRYLYWNMNYHVEHHMFPLVPYHNLPKLHALMKDDCPKPYGSILEAWKEIIPAVLRQVKDPGYYVRRELPPTARPSDQGHTSQAHTAQSAVDTDGWVKVGAAELLTNEDALRFDHDNKTYAIYRNDKGILHATDGICSHGRTHLADGMVKGDLIECPKHNGRFDIKDGSCQRPPVCVALKTHRVEERDGDIYFNTRSAGGCGAKTQPTLRFTVVSNENVATFIKELVLQPETPLDFTPGDYLQFDIPTYGLTSLKDVKVKSPYDAAWKTHHVFDATAENSTPTRRNYSIANFNKVTNQITFNIRIATPPPGLVCHAGAGSAHMFNLKPGDTVTAVGPYGDFHIKPSENEMIYVGGGAGMAPLRAHLTELLANQDSERTISFWYGARSKQELFYDEYFTQLADTHDNFSFTPALSEALAEDQWSGKTGFIHNVLDESYLKSHPDLSKVEFYLCGPPAMMQATKDLLLGYGILAENIAYDEF